MAGFIAHFSTAVEGLVPLVLFFSRGGWPTAIAAFVMIVFHLNILLAFPMGVPLEWNVFMIFGVLWLFVAHARLGLADVTDPLPIAILFVLIAGTVVIGNLYPRKVSFLPGMRYYAGNWDTTLWCVKPSVDEKFRTGSRALGPMQHLQLERLYGSKEETLIPLHLALAFRGMNTHGRALLMTFRFTSSAAPAPSAIPDPVHHHHDNERPDARQRHHHRRLGDEFDRPGLEVVGEAAGIRPLGQRIDGGRQLVAGDVDVPHDGLGVPVRHVSVLPVRLMHLRHYPRSAGPDPIAPVNRKEPS